MSIYVRRLVLLVGLVVYSIQGFGQDLIGSEVPIGRHPIDFEIEQQLGLRFRLVELNAAVAGHDRFEIGLFPDARITVTRIRTEMHQGVSTWVGRIDGSDWSSVIVAVHPSGVVAARIETERRSFFITHKRSGLHAVVELDPAKSPSEGPDDGVTDDVDDNEDPTDMHDGGPLSGKTGEVLINPDICLPASTCSNRVVTVLVAFSQDAEDVMGGPASTATWIAAGVAELNTVAANTGLAHTFELGLARKVDYVETNIAQTDLHRLRYADGYLDEVHVWRDSVGADLVHLVLDQTGCGVGNLTSNPVEFSSVRSYSVSNDGCFRTNKTFPHELGHNMGLRHDLYVDSASTPCDWAHGYVNQAAFGGDPDQRWRTIMAYNNQCVDSTFSCSRLAYYSNPANTLGGDKMGVDIGETDEADAFHVLDRSMCVVSDYRDAPAESLVMASFQEGYVGYAGARDTWIDVNSPTTSHGSANVLQSDGVPLNSALMYWDISSIPAGATIVKASISVSTVDLSSAEHELYPLKMDWNESTTTWNEAQGGIPWQAAGADGANDRGSTPLGAARSVYSGVLSIDLNTTGIAAIQDWVDGIEPNYGLIMKDSESSDGFYFESREAPDVGRRPRLTVWYEPPPPSIALQAAVNLEGAWNGSAMDATLATHLPSEHPFGGAPWVYAGDDSVSSVDISGADGVPDFFEANPSIVDWVLVELREATPPSVQTTVARRAGFVHTDGTVTDLDGSSNLDFGGIASSGYHVVVRHRNHLPVMSDSLVDFASGTGVHDFRSTLVSAYSDGGSPMAEVATGIFGLFGGDVNHDGQVTVGDFNDWLASTKLAETGYVSSDFDLDGQCTVTDFNLWLTNTTAAAASQVPD